MIGSRGKEALSGRLWLAGGWAEAGSGLVGAESYQQMGRLSFAGRFINTLKAFIRKITHGTCSAVRLSGSLLF